jgi:hypothetical protein
VSTETRAAPQPVPGWLPRAILSGFIASMTMAIAFFVAYGVARVATTVELANRRGAETFQSWVQALTNNQVLDLATGSLYAAGAVHLTVGVLWALLYGYYFEPRLPGAGWIKGLTFSLIPWVLSLVAFLPVVGGGFLGFALGAGPLPAIGNLVLHLVYGASLGAIYGPLGDIAADEFPHAGEVDEPRVVAQYERAAARGIVAGAILGLIVGVVVAIQAGTQGSPLGIPHAALPPVMAVIGATFGGVLGSISGLATGEAG